MIYAYAWLLEDRELYLVQHPRARYVPYPWRLWRGLMRSSRCRYFHDSERDRFVIEYRKSYIAYVYRDRVVIDPYSDSWWGSSSQVIAELTGGAHPYPSGRIGGYYRCRCGEVHHRRLWPTDLVVLRPAEGMPTELVITEGVRFPKACLKKLSDAAERRYLRHLELYDMVRKLLPKGETIALGDGELRKDEWGWMSFRRNGVLMGHSTMAEVTAVGSWAEKHLDELKRALAVLAI